MRKIVRKIPHDYLVAIVASRHLTDNWLAVISNLQPSLVSLYLGRILIGLFEILMSPDRFVMRPTYLTPHSKL